MKHNQVITPSTQSFFASKSIVALSLSALLAGSMSFKALANDEEVITVTATRSATNIDTSLATQVVITQADIARIQPKSVLDVISSVAGIDVVNQGGRGQISSLFTRGTNASHTLVLVNGIRVGSATLGTTDVQAIAPELIERIEIVKGPRAALWGSDAIGGVIQIFTRELKQGEFFVGATTGTDNYKQYKVGGGVNHGDGYTSVSVNKESSDGFDVLNSAEPDADGYDHRSVAINGQQQVTDQFALDWLAKVNRGDNEYDTAFGGPNESEVKNHAWLVRGVYQSQLGHVQNSTSFSVGQNRDHSRNHGQGVDSASETLFETRRDQLSVLNHSQVFPYLQINLGLDYYHEAVNSTTQYAQDERNVTGVFAHGLYSLNDITFEAALRYDDVENTDSETTYNLGAGYDLNQDTRIALNVGTGFKVPTFNDLYFPASQFSSGNPNLVSETSQTVELVFSTTYADVDMNFNVYRSDIDQLIVWQPDANFFYQPTNVDEAEIAGFEFVASYQGLGGQHQINATYTDAENKATGKQLRRRAKEQVSYQFDTMIGELALYVEYQYNGKRNDRDFSGDVVLDSYQLVNLAVSYPLTSSLKLEGRVTNAFNEQYQTALNYNTQERAAYIGVNYSL